MELYKNTFKVFLKSKGLWLVPLIYTLANVIMIVWEYSEIFGKGFPVLEYTRRFLMLSPQFFVIYLVISYEFFSEPNRTNLYECVHATAEGYYNRPLKSNFAVMFTVLFVNCACFTIIDLIITRLDMFVQEIEDIGFQGSLHIVACLFVNYFMISSIALLAGALISKISKRITAYALIMTIIFAASYLLNKIAVMVMILTDYSVNFFEILSILNIMPQGLTFAINNSLGFPIMTYRICLICFWICFLLLLLFLLYSRKGRYLKSGICLIICILCLFGYAMPASRIDMSMNSSGSTMSDQHYYYINGYVMDEEAGGFDVEQYIMELDTRRLLKARVTMKVSKSLDEFRFTLSHSYKVLEAYDQNSNALEFEQDKDALLVHGNNGKTTEITLVYEGANEAYYSNSQGINLPGSFPYYPIAGYRPITEDGQIMNSLFLEKDAFFDIKLKGKDKVYTNLKRVGTGHYIGESNGLSLFDGIYREVEREGVRIVYPYLIGWGDEELNQMASAMNEAGYNGCQVFIAPNMNKSMNAVSKEQVITTGYFQSIEDLTL